MQKFLFKGRAVALRGRITKPYYQDLGEHATAATYAGSAGHATARNEGFSIGKDVAYSAVEAEVFARPENNRYHNTVTAAVKGFVAAGGRITADLILCRLESVYDPRLYPGRKASRILPTGSKFVNLRVDGKEVQPKLPPAFTLSDKDRDDFLYGTYSDDATVKSVSEGDGKYYPGFYPEPIHIQGLGTLYFAEWSWVHPGEKFDQRLTMLRLALGSSLGLEMDCGDGSTDGKGWPP